MCLSVPTRQLRSGSNLRTLRRTDSEPIKRES